MLDVPPRLQYEENNGYCGEVTLQSFMLLWGAWIPQEVARAAGGGELLLGVNYDQAMANLRIAFTNFAGFGAQDYSVWAKQQLRAGYGVAEVAFLLGSPDLEYDHIMPLIGIETSAPDAYSASDVLHVNTLFSLQTQQRVLAGYTCTAADKSRGPWWQAGCIDTNYRYAAAIKGPAYAGIGPPTRLTGVPPSEPGLGLTTPMNATLTISGLTPGSTYALYMLTALAAVPTAPNPAALAAQVPLASFVAEAAVRSQAVTFQSGTPAYFICLPG